MHGQRMLLAASGVVTRPTTPFVVVQQTPVISTSGSNMIMPLGNLWLPGDYAIATFYCAEATFSTSTPTGWTNLLTRNAPSPANITGYWRSKFLAIGDLNTSVTFSVSRSTQPVIGFITIFGNINTTSPLDTSGTWNYDISNTTFASYGSITTATANALVFSSIATKTNQTITIASPHTTLFSQGTSGGLGLTVAASTKLMPTAGASAAVNATWTNATTDLQNTFALRKVP